MLTFYMCVFLIILETNAENHFSDNPVIVFNISLLGNSDVVKYTVVKNKPLKIVLLNFYPHEALCWNHYANGNNKEFLYKTFDRLERRGIMQVQNITDEMSTKWKCNVLANCSKSLIGGMECERFDIYFNIHVKGAKKVSFIVNNQTLDPDISIQPTTKLDGEIIHEYLDGQLIILSCETDIGTKRLKYYNAEGSLIFQTDERSFAPTFRSRLTSRNNYFYLECERYTTSPSETYYYRLTFVLRDMVPKYDDEVNVSINGITLAPTRSESGNTRYYNYYYEYGFEGTLNVTCQSNVYEKGRMSLEITHVTVLEVTTGASLMQSSFATKTLNNRTLICEYTNNDGSVVLARMKLWSAVASDTRIIGLPENNIEYQYSKSDDFYSINYRYSLNETVELTCVTNYPKTEKIVWNYNNKSTVFTPKQNYTFFGKSATLQFTLTAEYNATSIQCKTFDGYGLKAHTVDVFLDLDPDSVISPSPITGGDKPLIIIGGSIAVMVVIVIVICALCWCTRTRKKIIEDNYENLSNDSTIQAYPSAVENTYEDPEKVIQIRPSEAPTEAHYTEIDYFFLNQLPTYTNNDSYEIINDFYDHLNHNNDTCRINSNNSVSFRCKNNDYGNGNCFGGNNSNVTYKNNSIYNSRNGETSNCTINDDYGETKIY